MMNTNTNNLNTFTVKYDPNRSMDEVVTEDIQRRFGPNVLPIRKTEDIDLRKVITFGYRIKNGDRFLKETVDYETTVGDLICKRQMMEMVHREITEKPLNEPLTSEEKGQLKMECRSIWVIFCTLMIKGRKKKVIRSLLKKHHPSNIQLVEEGLNPKGNENIRRSMYEMIGYYLSQHLPKDEDNFVGYTDRINLTDEEIDEIVEEEQNPTVLGYNDLSEFRTSLKTNGVLSVHTSFVGGVQ